MTSTYRIGVAPSIDRPRAGGFQRWLQTQTEKGRRSQEIGTAREARPRGLPSSQIYRYPCRGNAEELRLIGEVFERVAPGKLLSLIKSSRGDPTLAQAAANAMSILISMGRVFSDEDLSGIRIRGARIAGGIFERTVLRGADLSLVNASNAIFRSAVLDGSQLEGIELGELPVFNGHTAWPESCLFFAKEEGQLWLFSAGPQDKTVVAYDLHSGAIVERYPITEGFSGATDLALSPDGSHLAIRTVLGAVKVWDTRTKRTEVLIWENADRGTGLAYSPDGKYLASFADDELILWNLTTTQTVRKSLGQLATPHRVACVRRGTALEPYDWIVVAEQDVWVLSGQDLEERAHYYLDVQGGLTRNIPASNLWKLRCEMAVSKDGQWVALALGNSSCIRRSSEATPIRVWRFSALLSENPSLPCFYELEGHTDSVSVLDFSPDGQQLLSGGENGTLFVWNVKDGRRLGSYEGVTEAIGCARFSPNGAWLACCRGNLPGIETNRKLGIKDVGVRVFKTDRLSDTSLFDGHSDHVMCVQVSPNGKNVVSVGHDGMVYFREANNGRLISIPSLFETQDYGKLESVCYSHDGERIAFGGEEGNLWIFSLRDQTPPVALKWHKQEISSIVSSPVAPLFASCGADGKVFLWDVSQQEPVHEFLPPGQCRMQEVAFSPNGTYLCAVTSDYATPRAAYIWDLHNRALIHVFPGGSSIDFSPCGRFLVSFLGSEEGLCVWDLDTREETRLALPHASDWGLVRFFGDEHVIFGSREWLHMWKWRESVYLGRQQLDIDIRALVVKEGGRVFVGGHDKAVRLWTLTHNSNREGPRWSARLQWSSSHSSDWSEARLQGVKGLSELNHALLLQKQAKILPADDQPVHLTRRHLVDVGAPVYALCLSQDLSILIGIGERGNAMVRKPNGTMSELNGPTKRIASIIRLPSGDIVIASLDRKLYRCDSAGALKDTQPLNTNVLTLLQSGGYASGGYNDGSVHIFDEGGGLKKKIQAHESGNRVTVVVDLENGVLASGATDGAVKLWDIASGRCIQTLGRHASEISSILYMGEGLLWTSTRNEIRSWTMVREYLPLTMVPTASPILSLQRISHTFFVSIARDGKVSLWNREGKQQCGIDESTIREVMLSCSGDGKGGLVSANHAGTIYQYMIG